jgi:hypothetical protein
VSRARIWHRAAVIGLLVVPAPLLAGVAAPAGSDAPRPLEIVWQVDDERDGDELGLVVDARSADVLALTSSSDSNRLRRLDGRTGAVEWAVEAMRMSRVASDGAGGAVLAGEGAQGQTLLFVSADGAVRDEVDSQVDAEVYDLVVDPGTRRACSLGARRRRDTGRFWVTSCWAADGTLIFSRAWKPEGGNSRPHALAVDPRSHRVYVVGSSGTYTSHEVARQDAILLAYTAGGRPLWQARSAGPISPSIFHVAVDPARRRVHVLGEATRYQAPMTLFSFGADGRKRFARSWTGRQSWLTSRLGLTSKGEVIVASAAYEHAEVRSYRPSGRLIRREVVRLGGTGKGSWADDVAIDTRRGLVHVIQGDGGDHPPATVVTLTFGGRRLSRVEVDDRFSVLDGTLAVHEASGRVYAGTTTWPDQTPRITALR